MMSNLVTITSKIYDASGKYVINLKVIGLTHYYL